MQRVTSLIVFVFLSFWPFPSRNRRHRHHPPPFSQRIETFSQTSKCTLQHFANFRSFGRNLQRASSRECGARLCSADQLAAAVATFHFLRHPRPLHLSWPRCSLHSVVFVACCRSPSKPSDRTPHTLLTAQRRLTLSHPVAKSSPPKQQQQQSPVAC